MKFKIIYADLTFHFKVMLSGIACGHFYFFLEDVFPLQQNGFRVLQTPHLLKWLLDPVPVEPVDVDERPGGFNWGEQPPRPE